MTPAVAAAVMHTSEFIEQACMQMCMLSCMHMSHTCGVYSNDNKFVPTMYMPSDMGARVCACVCVYSLISNHLTASQ